MQVLDLKEWIIREKSRINKVLLNLNNHNNERSRKLVSRVLHMDRILRQYPTDVRALRNRLDGGLVPGQIAIYSAKSGVGRSTYLDFDNNSDKE